MLVPPNSRQRFCLADVQTCASQFQRIACRKVLRELEQKEEEEGRRAPRLTAGVRHRWRQPADGFCNRHRAIQERGSETKKTNHPCLAHLQLLREFHGCKPPLPHQFGLILFMSNLCRIESMHVIYQREEVLRPDSTFLNGRLCSGVEMGIRSHYRRTLCLLNSRWPCAFSFPMCRNQESDEMLGQRLSQISKPAWTLNEVKRFSSRKVKMWPLCCSFRAKCLLNYPADPCSPTMWDVRCDKSPPPQDNIDILSVSCCMFSCWTHS